MPDSSVVGGLKWVKGEILVSLNHVRILVEGFVGGEDLNQDLNEIVSSLHEVRGVLLALQLGTPALLTEEMRRLCEGIANGSVASVQDAAEALVLALIQLPNYLDRVDAGRGEAPLVLLPVINDIRESRGERPMSEAELLVPSSVLSDGETPDDEALSGLQAIAQKARPLFHRFLLQWYRGEATYQGLVNLERLFNQIYNRIEDGLPFDLFRAAESFSQGMLEGTIPINASTKGLMGRIDQVLKPLDAETPVWPHQTATHLLLEMLGWLSEGDPSAALVVELTAVYQPVQSESAEPGSGGDVMPGARAMSYLAGEIRKDLAAAKDDLDLYVRGNRSDRDALERIEQQLQGVAATVAVTESGELVTRVQSLAGNLGAIASGEKEADDRQLMSMAEELLSIDAVLASLGRSGSAAGTDQWAPTLGKSELLLAALREARVELAKSKEIIDNFAADPSDIGKLRDVPSLLDRIAGALRMVAEDDAASVLDGVTAPVRRYLDSGRVIEREQLELVARALSGVELFMDSLSEGQADHGDLLVQAKQAASDLAVAPMVTARGWAEIEETMADEPDELAETRLGSDEAEAVAVAGDVERQHIDAEFLEIFLEEAREEQETIAEQYQRWAADRRDETALTTLRRSFHTLKGSGRLVGADRVAEFSRATEGVLNRIIEQTLPVNTEVLDFVTEAVARLPDLIAAESEGRAVDIGPLLEQAQDLVVTKFEEPEVSSSSAGAEPGKVIPWPGAPVGGSPEAAESGDDLGGALGAIDEQSGLATDEHIIESLADDEDLLEIFLGETEEHLAVLSDFLATTTMTADATGAEPPESVVRALHTLTGSSRMAGVEAMGELTRRLELRLSRKRELGETVDPWLEGVLERATSALHAYVIELPHEGPARRQLLDLVAELDQGAVLGDRAEIADELAAEILKVAEAEQDGGAEEAAVGSAGREQVEQVLEVEGIEEVVEIEEVPEVEGVEEIEGVEEVVEAVVAHRELPEVTALLKTAKAGVEALEIAAPEPETVEDDREPLPDDPELIGIFLEEARDLLDSLDQDLGVWQREPGGLSALNGLKRRLHTLKGNARLTGLGAIGDLSHSLESLLTTLDEGHQTVDDQILTRVQVAADTLSAQVDAVEQGEPVPRARDVLELLKTATMPEQAPGIEPALPEPVILTKAVLDPEDVEALPDDSELVAVFLEDARDLLDVLDQQLRAWQLEPLHSEHVSGLQRTLHTLKGSARLSGIASIGDLSHALESLFDGVAERSIPVGDDTLELAQRTVDALSEQVEAVEEGHAVPWARGIVEALGDVRSTGADDQAPGVADVAVMAPAPRTARAKPAAPSLAAAVPESVSTAQSFAQMVAGRPDDEARAGGLRSLIRVRSDLLDRLVDHSGEISIYGSRLAQKNGLLGFSLNELDQTVGRLREQLRYLDIETETQILNRYERDQDTDQPTHEDFDPLELDRFSTMQQLSRSLSETVNDLVSLKRMLGDTQRESADLLIQQARISDDLQGDLLRTRMVPFVQVVPKLHRLVRQTANSLGKAARLEVFGPEVELDRGILDRLVAPLEHLLRNAVAHGIETKEDRIASGKPESGVVTLVLSREGNDVIITLSDDGAGMNLGAIRERAITRGVLAPGVEISDDDLMQLTLEAGFTTASRVTQIAGRGVGLDVVASEIKKANGTLTLDSIAGRGTSFVIHIPLTLAIVEALLVDVGERAYAVPHSTLEAVDRISRSALETAYSGGEAVFEHGGHPYRVLHLGGILDPNVRPELGDRRWFPLLLVRSGDQRVALHVDNLRESQKIVVKPLGSQLNGVRWLNGGTILPDGGVALILDAIGLVRSSAVRDYSLPVAVHEQPSEEKRLCVMVVDDSLTVRRVTGRLLRRQNMEVISAKDGVEALDLLQERIPDVMLLDIEMPRMDGYELTRHIRRSPYTRDIPIIMITSRTGAKHQEYAAKLGVDRYLGKPYQESELLDEISSVLVEASS